MNLQQLRVDILKEYTSIYKFCKQCCLNPSTVYMVLDNRYSGNSKAQVKRIKSALTSKKTSGELENDVFRAIKSIACVKCNTTGDCKRCDALFYAQTKEVLRIVHG